MGLEERVRSWFDDALLQKLLKDSSQLLAGNVVEGVLSFLAVVLAARGLGPERYGILVLVQTYIIIVDNFVNFQSWQALIKYGADAIEGGDSSTFKRLIKFGTCLDVGTALLGTAMAIAGIYAVESWMQWSHEFTTMLVVYCAFILSNLTGTPLAILRLFDRFDVLAIQKIAVGVVKLGAVGVAFFVHASVWGYLTAWLTTEVLGHLLLLGLGWWELHEQKYSEVLGTKLVGLTKPFPGLWRYVWSTNLNGTVKMASRRFDTVIVAGLLGPAAVGLYEVVKKFSKGLRQLESPLYQAIYPELAKLWTRDNRGGFVRLMVRSAGLAGGAAVLCWTVTALFGTQILEVIFGPDYLNAYAVLVWYILGAVVAIAAFPLTPGLLTMGYPQKGFVIRTGATVVYFITLVWLLSTLGLVGAGIAYLVFHLVWTAAMMVAEYRILRGSRSSATSRS